MSSNTILESLPEIGIGLVGFTGLVVVLGQRARGQWTQSELVLFYLLLHMSTIVVFLSLIPTWLSQLELSSATIWQISSGFLALGHGSSFGWALSSIRKAAPSPSPSRHRQFGIPIFVIGALVIIAEVVVAFGLLKAYAEFIFTGALLWVLFLAVVSFISLLFPTPGSDNAA